MPHTYYVFFDDKLHIAIELGEASRNLRDELGYFYPYYTKSTYLAF